MENVVKGWEQLDFERLRRRLDEFKIQRSNELDFRPIEKFMIEELGAERLPNKGGSHIVFRHPVLQRCVARTGGIFRVALKKKSKRPILYRRNFLEYTYPELSLIIDLLEKEEKGEI